VRDACIGSGEWRDGQALALPLLMSSNQSRKVASACCCMGCRRVCAFAHQACLPVLAEVAAALGRWAASSRGRSAGWQQPPAHRDSGAVHGTAGILEGTVLRFTLAAKYCCGVPAGAAADTAAHHGVVAGGVSQWRWLQCHARRGCGACGSGEAIAGRLPGAQRPVAAVASERQCG